MSKYKKYWDDICQVHFATKKYIILAEEFDDEFKFFWQPVKEHRDAYDHIIRVYGTEFNENYDGEKKKDDELYKESNMKKALGHEYRAFFDICDWFSLLLRGKIAKTFDGYSIENIIKIYKGYKEYRLKLLQFNEEIAKIRNGKDVYDNIDIILKYGEIVDDLYEEYKLIEIAFANNL